MFQGRPQGAHRISYMLYVGEIPKDMWVLHKCDNPLCVNANHLFLGTHYDNDMDREKKGRGKNGGNLGITIGEKHGGSKLKNEDILNIRKRNIRGKGGNTPLLALEFNVKSKTINDIVAYRTWKHLK